MNTRIFSVVKTFSLLCLFMMVASVKADVMVIVNPASGVSSLTKNRSNRFFWARAKSFPMVKKPKWWSRHRAARRVTCSLARC